MVYELDPHERSSWPPFVDPQDVDLLGKRFASAARDDPERKFFDRVLRRALDDAHELDILFGELPGVLAGDPSAIEHFRSTLDDAARRGVGARPVDPSHGPSPLTPIPDPPQSPCQPRFLIQPFVVSAIIEGIDRVVSGDKSEFLACVNVVGGLWRQTDPLERFYRLAFGGVSTTGRDRLADTLQLIARDQFPGDEPRPIIWPPDRGGIGLPRDPCELARDACRTMVLGGAARLTIPLPSSTHADGIRRIAPPSACAGDTIRIAGAGFGTTQPPDVILLVAGLPARVVAWSDREIVAVVPDGAPSGCVGFRNERIERQRRELHEQNQRAREEINEGLLCLRRGAIWPRVRYVASAVPCTGTNHFLGSLPVIDLFQVNGQTQLTARPGTELLLTWSVRNATAIGLQRISSDGPAVSETNPGGELLNVGTFTGSRATDARYELTATNVCGSVTATVTVALRARLRILGIEVVQSTQTTDNLLPLVPGKTTAVRVYVQSDDGDWEGAGARLTVVGSSSGRLSPENAASIIVKAAGSDRRSLDDSFLFKLPGRDITSGDRFLKAEVFSGAISEPPSDSSARRSSFSTVAIEAHVYGVTMGYSNVSRSAQREFGLTGPDWPAKDFSAFERQRQLAEGMFPVRKLEVRRLPGDPAPGIFDYDGGNGYVEGRAWGHRLIDMNFPNGGERIYVLQPEEKAGEYNGNTEGSANGNIVMNGWDTPNDRGATFAHELGHSWTLSHVGIDPGTGDPFDPNTDFPYPDGWTGPDVGVRFVPNLAFLPGDDSSGDHVRYDIMTYETPQWISPFHYCKLMKVMSDMQLSCPAGSQTFSLRRKRLPTGTTKGPSAMGIRLTKGKTERRFLYVLVRLSADGRASLDPFEVITSSEDIESRPKGSTYELVLEDERGEALAVHRFDRPITTAVPPEKTALFSMFVAYDAPAARVVLRRGTEILAERRPSKEPPQVRLSPLPSGRAISGKQTVSWEARDPEGGELTFSLWYSADDGDTFLALNTAIRGNSVVVDFDHVPPSDRAELKLLASNGMTTLEIRWARFVVGRRSS